MFNKIYPAACLLGLVCSAPLIAEAQQTLIPEGARSDVVQARILKDADNDLRRIQFLEVVEEEESVPVPEEQRIPFFVKRIEISAIEEVPGDLSEDLKNFKKLRPMISELEGREITIEDVRKLNVQIEQVYRHLGYFAVVLIPSQKLEDQILRLEILFTRLGDISVENNRFFRKKKILSYWKTNSDDFLRYDDMQYDVMLMNENPDRVVRPILMAGEEFGRTNVVLNVEDKFPVHLDYTFDNMGVKLTGKETHGFTLRHNNFLSLDDTLFVGTRFGHRFGAFFASHVLPLNSHGTRLVTTFSHSQVNPKKEFTDFGINGTSQTYGLSLRQHLYRSTHVAVDSHVGFDFKEKRTRVLSVTSVWDRLRNLNFGVTAMKRDKSGLWRHSQDFTFGFPLHGDGFPLTSRGAETQFFKYEASIERRQNLPMKTHAMMKVRTLLTPAELVPQEQIFLGGMNTVRGYPESDFGADKAIVTNLEYWVPFSFLPDDLKLFRMETPLEKQLHTFVFADHAYGHKRDPDSERERSQHYLGLGVGLDFRFTKHLSANVAWGVALADDPLTESGNNQFHFQIKTHI